MLFFDDAGLAAITIGSQDYYVRRNGRMAAVLRSDNGPDLFSGGLVRNLQGGKVGFLDKNLRQVISPVYDWAWPFEGGKALVCKGCHVSRPGEDGHSAVIGAIWGYIDPQGREVIPVRFSREELRKMLERNPY
jgi:hypothetical protein